MLKGTGTFLPAALGRSQRGNLPAGRAEQGRANRRGSGGQSRSRPSCRQRGTATASLPSPCKQFAPARSWQARPAQGSCQASVCHDVLASGQRAPQVLGTPSPTQLSLMRELGRAGTQSTAYFQGFPAPWSRATWDGALRMTVRGAEPTFGEGFTAAPPLPEAAFITGVPLTKRRLCLLGSMNPPLVTCLLSGKSAPFPPRTRLSSAPRAGCVPGALRVA